MRNVPTSPPLPLAPSLPLLLPPPSPYRLLSSLLPRRRRLRPERPGKKLIHFDKHKEFTKIIHTVTLLWIGKTAYVGMIAQVRSLDFA